MHARSPGGTRAIEFGRPSLYRTAFACSLACLREKSEREWWISPRLVGTSASAKHSFRLNFRIFRREPFSAQHYARGRARAPILLYL